MHNPNDHRFVIEIQLFPHLKFNTYLPAILTTNTVIFSFFVVTHFKTHVFLNNVFTTKTFNTYLIFRSWHP